MRLLTDRSGVSFEMTDWLLKLGLILAAAVAIIFLLQYYLAVTVETQDLRSEVFLQRVLSSPTGITHVDAATGVAWPGIIDFAKFSDAQLAASLVPSEHDWIAAELSLQGKTIHYNGEQYAQWQKMVAAGSGMSTQREVFVLIKQGDTLKRGKLSVTMITPRD